MDTIQSINEFLVHTQKSSSTSGLSLVSRRTTLMEGEGEEMLMKKLPKEMLTEILMKLPVKSLVRLSCVCKAWRAFIIGNPYFGNKHLNYWRHCNYKNHDDPSMLLLGCYCLRYGHQEDPYILTRDSYNNPLAFVPRPLDLPFYNHNKGTTLGGGSCNGILCLAIDGIVRLCNPITGEVVTLPPGLFWDDVVYKEHLLLGFGFDVSTDDYKVIKICDVTGFKGARKQLKKRYAVEIYKHSTNCWRKLDMDLKCEEDNIYGFGVFVNGFYHWWIDKKLTHPRKMIHTFDFQAEIFGEIECPDPSLDMNSCLAAFDGSLAVFSRSVDCSDVHVWVMTEYGKKESWTKKFSIRELSCEIKCRNIHNLWIQDRTIVLLLVNGEVMEVSIEEGCTKEEARFRMLFRLDSVGVKGVVFRPTLVSLLRGRHDEQVVDLFQDFDFVGKENGNVGVANSTTVMAESELNLGSSSASASHEFEEECCEAEIQEFPSELDQDIDEGWMEWEHYYDNATQFDQNLDLQQNSNQSWEYLDPTQFIMNWDCPSFRKAGPVAMDVFHGHDEVQEFPSATVNDSEIEGWMTLP